MNNETTTLKPKTGWTYRVEGLSNIATYFPIASGLTRAQARALKKEAKIVNPTVRIVREQDWKVIR